ncbi:MAG: hypothetical protein F6K40_32385 [Okeania sp. SIO3I5]|uniref:hypothetical protein n=1 Tax=Okeania sp. SIO3I5 TaxID=2607805 RepID=UPI0013B63DE4|nr:hypothetical protein [Okeania sp. SIO3I5]NEQ40671.1 hypothetical protein [Okeania sp. SIO3I5]
MNLPQINQKFFQLGAFTLGTFLLLTSSARVLGSTPAEIKNKTTLAAQASRQEWRICDKKGENWSEVKYFESKNYFANICRNANSQLTLVAGAKSNPNELLELPVSGGQGYLAIDGSKTFMIDNTHFSMAINGLVVRKEQVIYRGE